jgi:hypothetical protein
MVLDALGFDHDFGVWVREIDLGDEAAPILDDVLALRSGKAFRF